MAMHVAVKGRDEELSPPCGWTGAHQTMFDWLDATFTA
jgi:hypothetical protein